MMQNRLLSVVIPTYDRDIDVLRRSIESVLAQDYDAIEIIVVDDNPDDNAYSHAIRTYCDQLPNVTYVKQDGNQGACAARNLGIHISRGGYIGFLDDDDIWEPEKAARQIERFTADTVGMVFCKGLLVDQNDNTIKPYYNANYFREKIEHQDLLVHDCIGTTSQAIVRRECFDRCGYFNELLPARQDYEMWLRISREYEIVGVDAFLFRHCHHQNGQISRNHKKSLAGYKMVYKLHKHDFKRVKKGRRNMVLHIVKSAKRSKALGDYLKYGLLYLWINPAVLIKTPYRLLLKLLGAA